MPELTHFASMKPPLPTVTPQPSLTAAPLTLSVLTTTTTTPLPRDELHMQVHTILIVVIFCVVCLLLLLAFLYAFCLHCSIGSSPKDSNRANGCSLEREDATYKCSSSDNQSVGNVIWLWHETRIAAIVCVFMDYRYVVLGLVLCMDVCCSAVKKTVKATFVHLFISHLIRFLFVPDTKFCTNKDTCQSQIHIYRSAYCWNIKTVYQASY